MENNSLTHHGILGMKWGVRRFQNKDGSLTPAGKKRQRGESEEADATTVKPKAKRISEMSDAELREKITRLELENRLRSLTKDSKSSRGKDFTLRVIEKIGENTITNLGTQTATKIIGVAINEAFGKDSYDTKYRIVNPNKGQSDKK